MKNVWLMTTGIVTLMLFWLLFAWFLTVEDEITLQQYEEVATWGLDTSGVMGDDMLSNYEYSYLRREYLRNRLNRVKEQLR